MESIILPTHHSQQVLQIRHDKTYHHHDLSERLSGRFDSTESLIESLVPPLIKLGLVNPIGDYHNLTHDSNLESSISSESSSFWKRELPRIHCNLLTHIAVDWRLNLIENNHWHSIYYAWFGLPTQKSDNGECDSNSTAIKMSCIAIESLARCLTTPTSSQCALHPDTLDTIIELTSQILETYSLSDWYFILFDPKNKLNSRQTVQKNEEWRQFINTLLSIPDKITNATSRMGASTDHTQFPPRAHRLDWVSLLTRLSLHFESLLRKTAQENQASIDVQPLSSFISKLIRIGFITVDVNPKSCSREKATAELYRCYLGNLEDTVHGEDSEIGEVLQELIIERPSWNIGTARALSRWISHEQCAEEARPSLARRALKKFCSKTQISHGSASHHAFVLLILLLNSCPIDTKSRIIDLTSDPKFHEGVHQSLDSLRKRIRLLGMLMAELLTGFEEPGRAKTIKHDFGSEIWNEVDDDTNLCRQLRMLVEKWAQLTTDSTVWQLDIATQLEKLNPSTLHTPLPISKDHNQRLIGRECDTSSPRVLPLKGKNRHASETREAQHAPPNEDSTVPVDIKGLSISAPSQKQNKRPMIEVLNSSTPGLQPYDISDDDLAELDGELNDEADGSHTVEQMYNSRSKVKPKIPVYIHDLTEYFKDAENHEKIELALKTAESLIRRKKGWGNELIEHSLDLTFALLLLQDSFDLDNFSVHRQAALTALVVSVPEKVAPCLIEQLFFHQYSITQRICMLNALVLGAKELAESTSISADTIKFRETSNLTASSHMSSSQINNIRSLLDSRPELLSDMSQDLTKHTLERVRDQNVSEGPVIQARSSNTTRISSTLEKARLQKLTPGINQPARLPLLATEYFIMPMINRMWIYLEEATSAQLDKGRGQPYLGSGWAILLQPMLLSRFVQSLTILLYLSRNSVDFLNVYLVESLVLSIKLRTHIYESRMSGEEIVESALLELNLMVLDITINLGGGWKLIEESRGKGDEWIQPLNSGEGLLGVIHNWAAAVVEVEQHRTGSELTRTGLAAVGIIVLIERLMKRQSLERSHGLLLGFSMTENVQADNPATNHESTLFQVYSCIPKLTEMSQVSVQDPRATNNCRLHGLRSCWKDRSTYRLFFSTSHSNTNIEMCLGLDVDVALSVWNFDTYTFDIQIKALLGACMNLMAIPIQEIPRWTYQKMMVASPWVRDTLDLHSIHETFVTCDAKNDSHS
ncbi:uncharacterized protein MELLADRAFT_105846 [Melampsora larici-populina 98AG31]|uniref:Telomere length regulation protein conserved domain-containing protein n=1 Tax=Melampsora larici-populina (strain 98AG31 / pathotype 3-4-7) TaxID=747676 RepID=F4RJI9_MELLP|nr:uncharacterized protein MELLADRAFT_105846 [Melampsora larici-populina 98AG31]EGG07483.1 hypothetical protein MELLADRAFT_105846 [Melampsora larici-populina 98AG31]